MDYAKRQIPVLKKIRLAGTAFSAVVAMAIFYIIIFSAFARNSDVLNGYLAGLDMGHGNWRLCHWHIVMDSFWFQDDFFYAVSTFIFGNRPFLIVVIPALSWATLVVVSWTLAQRGRVGKDLLWASAVIGVALAVPVFHNNPIIVFLGVGSDHVVTVLQCVALFLTLDFFIESGRILLLFAAFALCSITVASDPLSMFIGVIPVFVASLLSNQVRLDREILVIASVFLATIIGKALLLVNSAHGGFRLIDNVPGGFTHIGTIGRHLRILFEALIGFWGSNFFGLSERQAASPLLRLPMVMIAFFAVGRCIPRLFTGVFRLRRIEIEFIDGALLVGIATVVLACVFSRLLVGYWAGRYLLPVFVYMAILTARSIPEIETRGFIATMAVIGTLMAANGYHWTMHPTLKVRPGMVSVTAWLARHNLRFGYAQYWTAAPIRVESKGRILALQLVEKNGRLAPYIWNNRSDLYPKKLGDLRPFFVIVDPKGSPAGAYSQGVVEATFGRPGQRAVVDGFTVDVYR